MLVAHDGLLRPSKCGILIFVIDTFHGFKEHIRPVTRLRLVHLLEVWPLVRMVRIIEQIVQGHLEFDAVNDNLPEIIEFYGHNRRKISCDYYIDDRMMLPENAKA